MRAPHPDPARPSARPHPPARPASRRRLGLAPLLLASCGTENPCNHPPAEIGAVATDVRAADDPCAGKSENHVVDWFTRQGARYPLRCGRRDPRGSGRRDQRMNAAANGHLGRISHSKAVQK